MAQVRMPTEAQVRVRLLHIKRLDRVHALLATLNDAFAGVADLAEQVEAIPILAGRCIRRAAATTPPADLGDFRQVLTRIGNRGLEEELMLLLEDLTLLKAESEAPERSGGN